MRTLLLILPVVSLFALTEQQSVTHEICRFTHWFTQDSLISDGASFNATYLEQNIFYWDGQFHQDGVGYHQLTGMTIDHILVGYTTGVVTGPPELISNPLNEAYHVMLLTHAIAGSPQAASFVLPSNPAGAPELAFGILTKKLSTYSQFNASYPGYGGFIPDFAITNSSISPTVDFDHKVSALDNGPLVWSIYSMIQVLSSSQDVGYQQLAVKWATYFIYLRNNAKNIFFHGPQLGSICAVSTLNPQVSPSSSSQKYACEDDTKLLNDPYQGEIMTWFLFFSGSMNETEGHEIWLVKRSQLQAMNYTGSIVDAPFTQGGAVNYAGKPINGRHIVPITSQKGLYFDVQEQIKLIFLPYLDTPIIRRVMANAERIRTCNSDLMDQNPGMFASTTNSTSPTAQQNDIQYILNAGIPSAATNMTQEQDMITPYASFATVLFDNITGLIWYNNILSAPCMQTVYGSADGIRRDGSMVSRVVSWRTKAPTLLALLGGIADFVREGLKRDNVYMQFTNVTAYEYGRVFDEDMNGGAPLMGEDVALCLPTVQVSTLSLSDYSSCRYEVGFN